MIRGFYVQAVCWDSSVVSNAQNRYRVKGKKKTAFKKYIKHIANYFMLAPLHVVASMANSSKAPTSMHAASSTSLSTQDRGSCAVVCSTEQHAIPIQESWVQAAEGGVAVQMAVHAHREPLAASDPLYVKPDRGGMNCSEVAGMEDRVGDDWAACEMPY